MTLGLSGLWIDWFEAERARGDPAELNDRRGDSDRSLLELRLIKLRSPSEIVFIILSELGRV